jgi:hypothetical protein
MGCTHAQECPLFPLLNASLRGWRRSYCDTEDDWRGCARYQRACRGQLVPISLLPNGRDVEHLRSDFGADRSRTADPRQAPPSRPNFGSSETTALFEPARALVRPSEPPPSAYVPQPPASSSDRLTTPAQQAHGETRRWWTRLADWMKGPA